jgi:hypothetical protein
VIAARVTLAILALAAAYGLHQTSSEGHVPFLPDTMLGMLVLILAAIVAIIAGIVAFDRLIEKAFPR